MPFSDDDELEAVREQEWEQRREREWDGVCGHPVRIITTSPWGWDEETEGFCIGVKGHGSSGHLIATEPTMGMPSEIIARMLPMHESRPF